MKGINGFILLVGWLMVAQVVMGQTIPEKISVKLDSLNPAERVKLLSDLCWKNREKDSDMALLYGMEGIKIAEAKGYNWELSRLYNFVGVIYEHYKYKTSEAIPYYDKALKIGLQINDSIEVAYVYNNLGDAFYLAGNIPLAREYAEKSLDMFLRLDNQLGIAYSYINMGLVNRISQQYDSALYYFNKAISVRKAIDDSIGIASATLEVAVTLNEMGKFNEAMNYFKESLDKHKKLNNKNYMAYSFHGIGDVYCEEGKYDSALVYYTNALELNLNRNNVSGVISNQLGIAKVYAYTKRDREGEVLLRNALANATESGITKNILEVYKTWATFYQVLKNYKKASENYQNYIAIYDSLYAGQQFQTLTELKKRFQMSEQLNKINNDLLEKEREQRYLFIIIFLLLVIALNFVLRYRTKVKLSKALQASNSSKDKVLSIISHDLVNPFNVLLGFSELQIEDFKDGNIDEAKHKGEIIYKTTSETFNLVTNLLNWARSQRGKITLMPVTFDIVTLMEEVCAITANMAKSKGIDLRQKTKERIEIVADKDLIRTVLLNLVSNALKYTHDGGIVELEAEQKDKNVVIWVKDNGIGISKEKISTLFGENEIASTLGTNNEKGTGLGLIVCKEFIEKHNGMLSVTSEEGKGSVFSFTLPL